MGCTVNHIQLICRDLQTMVDFFTDNFDAKLVIKRKHRTADGVDLNLGGTLISLRVRFEDEELVDDISIKTYGYHHIGITVDDVDKKFKEMVDKGFASWFPPKKGLYVARCAGVVGPDNVAIELLTERKWN